MQNTKKFSMLSCVLTLVCVIFVAEATAPVASIGNSQYFWWMFMIVLFLLPYGLISSELGTAFNKGGGPYDWVCAAFGHKWGRRTAWKIWVTFPLWTASLAIIIPELLTVIAGKELSTPEAIIAELGFIWIVFRVSCTPTADALWILNGSAVIKMALAIGIGVLGVIGAVKNGMANPITFSNLLPSFDLHSLSFISAIIFNMLGFEVICTMSGDMENPKKQIPQAIVLGGIVIAVIYMFSAFGIGAAIPTSKISASSGLLDAFSLLTGKESGLFISVVAVLFGLTLFGNMISWSGGVHKIAAYAADNGDMPAVFGKRNPINGMPVGGMLMTAAAASVIVMIAPLIPNQNMFWSFFALNLVLELMSYIPMFPAFLKLRRVQPDAERPFRVPGSGMMLYLVALIPVVLITASIIFTAIPLSFDKETLEGTLPITIGTVLFLLIGELVTRPRRHNGQRTG